MARCGRRAALLGYGVALCLLLAKAYLNLHPPLEFALLGWWSAYPFLQSYLIFPLGLTCLGLAAGLLTDARNRRAVTALAVFMVLVSLWTERWVIVEPDGSSTATADAMHHCRQTTDFTCGPASCVSLLSVMGVAATEGEMAVLCRTPSYGGTSLFRICLGLNRKLGDGYRARIVDGDLASLQRRGGPAIVAVRRLHVLTLRFLGGMVVILDPARVAPEVVSLAEAQRRFGGAAVVVVRRSRVHISGRSGERAARLPIRAELVFATVARQEGEE